MGPKQPEDWPRTRAAAHVNKHGGRLARRMGRLPHLAALARVTLFARYHDFWQGQGYGCRQVGPSEQNILRNKQIDAPESGDCETPIIVPDYHDTHTSVQLGSPKHKRREFRFH